MNWTWLLVPASAAAFLAACWWGSNVVLNPAHKAELDVSPEEFGLEHEKLSFQSRDGLTLRGWAIPARIPTDRTVLLCHGWSDHKGDMLRRFKFLHDRFNLFLFDSRAHGDSDGNLSSIGYLESRDFDAALGWLKERRPLWAGSLGLLGLSMGAAMSVYGMAHNPELRCAVLESPFGSFNGVVSQFTQNNYSLPLAPMVWVTLRLITLRLGGNPEPYSPAYHISRLAPRPVFFIAGERDRLMPLDVVRALHAASGEPKELWVIPEATHGRCQEVAGGEYDRRIGEFFDKNL